MTRKILIKKNIDAAIDRYLQDKPVGHRFHSDNISRTITCYGGVDAREVASRLSMRGDCISLRGKKVENVNKVGVWEYIGAKS